MDIGDLKKVGNNEKEEVTKPIIIIRNNSKSGIVGEHRALNTYTISDRYATPIIHETITQILQAELIKAMDALKCLHQNVSKDNARKLLTAIVHCGKYEYLRITFGIKIPLPTTRE
ncbi:hypothetical protein O181_048864 [Austropuccinia psidii MF-1]|uniref:Reverse transcriptase domain-containing protein n=1 Tax=Austropuccinia psidii MF-1 TaxID=1389203 RepID=A0A9Q3DTP6_9BASI|nr:hypothetical protein [Austropuccinia psidii MF-1]